MNVKGLFLAMVLILVVWFGLGFVGFIIEAKYKNFTEFDKVTKDEFVACVMLGMITFLYMSFCYISDWFNRFMGWLLKKINQ